MNSSENTTINNKKPITNYSELWESFENEERDLLRTAFRNFLILQGLGIYVGGGIGFQLATRNQLLERVWKQALPKVPLKMKKWGLIGLFGITGSLTCALISSNLIIKAISKLETPLGRTARSLTRSFKSE